MNSRKVLIAGLLVAVSAVRAGAATNIYSENMVSVAEWGTYQASFVGSSNGVATLTENGPNVWGKSWVYAGFFDVSAYPWLHLKVNNVSTGRLIVALSYASDAYYQNMAYITNSGWFAIPISNWVFNSGHNYTGGGLDNREYTFVQLVAEGQNASAQVDELYISDSNQPYPGNVIFRDTMTNTANWGTYNVTYTANGLGQTVLASTNVVWGRNWRWAGRLEITQYPWLKCNISAANAGVTNARISISGPNDQNVQNLGYITNAGQNVYYVGNWIGNNAGTNEDVYIRFDASNYGSITIDQVELSDGPSLIPTNTP